MPLNISTPPIDPIFSLDCLKLNEMKGLFKTIFEYLQQMGDKLDNIPDFSELLQRLGRLERGQDDLNKRFDKEVPALTTKVNELSQHVNDKLMNHGERIVKLENAIKNFDIDAIFERDEFKQLRRKVDGLQDTLNVNCDRIKKLEDYRDQRLEPLIKDNFEPRISELERKFSEMDSSLQTKVSFDDLSMEMEKKADVGALDYLRESIEKINELVNDFMNQFADKQQNDREHKLLQKQLKALYDLIMSMQGDDDDAMFTVKGLRCAACAKGVQNLEKFKAAYVPWNSLPFKAGGSRVKASGTEFSQMFTTAQPGDMHFTQTQPGAGTMSTSAHNQRSAAHLDGTANASPAKNPDAIFQPANRRLVGKQQRPQTANPKMKSSGPRPISASVYKGSYF